jgi:ATP-dependent protease ClpP protease subunit
MKAIILVVFLLQATPLAAYPLVDAQCKDDPQVCIEAGKLDYVSIYGDIGDEDLEFFTMLDKSLPPDAPFPRVFLNSYGGKVSAGIGIGRILRKHQAAVESGSPVVPDSTLQCSSACALVAQGAAHRRLTHVGLHSTSVRVQTGENVWETQAGSMDDVMEYMTEMGATAGAKKLIARTDFDEMMQFAFDPVQPVDDQIMYKLGFYDLDDKYFAVANPVAPDSFFFKSAEEYMVNAANYGSIQAMRDLAALNSAYDPDVKPDFVTANRWLKMAADKGDAMSIHNLAYHYSYGIGVEQDQVKGAALYLRASKLGLAASQNNLGWAYYTGEGVPKSLPDAVYWITKSAEQGEAFAYGSLCEISGATDLFKTDLTEAYMWCSLAMNHLDVGAARDAAQTVYDQIMKAISQDDFAAGSLQVQKWDDDHVTTTMRNVGDDLN